MRAYHIHPAYGFYGIAGRVYVRSCIEATACFGLVGKGRSLDRPCAYRTRYTRGFQVLRDF